MRGVSLAADDGATDDIDFVSVEEDPNETDGNSTTEVNMDILSQVVGTCVVSSFTEHQLHKTDNPLMPTLLINSNYARVILYDCVTDVLLISNKINLFNCDGKTVAKSAILFLWIFINHRYCHVMMYIVLHYYNYRLFLGGLGNVDLEKSTIQSRLSEDNKLDRFKQLCGKQENWQRPQTFFHSDEPEVTKINITTEPPHRKRPRHH